MRRSVVTRHRDPVVIPMPVGAVAGSWSLAFQDEFSGSSVDTTKWDTSWQSEGGVQNNTPTYAANISVTGGNLVLVLSSDSTSGASLHTAQTAGRYQAPINSYTEASVYFAGSASTGEIYNWDAFWTSGDNWPSNGEHDVAEGLGGDMTVNYHYGVNPAGERINNSAPRPGVWYNAFHTYAIHRLPNRADVYFDGVLNRTYVTNDLGGGHEIIFNLGKSSSRTPVPGAAGALKVAYVRSWISTTPTAIYPNWPLTVSAVGTSDTTIDVTWLASTVPLGGSALTGYRFYDSTTLLKSVGLVTSTTLTGLNGGYTYVLGVKGVNATGESTVTSATTTVSTTYTLSPFATGSVVRGNSQQAESDTATTIVVTTPTGIVPGDVLVASVGASNGVSPNPIISGSGWTRQAVVINSAVVASWTKLVTDTAEPSTYTMTGNSTSGRISGVITAYRGISPTSITDGAAVTNIKDNLDGSVLNLTTSTVTSNAVLFAACAGDFASAPALYWPTQMNRLSVTSGSGRRLVTADEARPTAGSVTRTFTEAGGNTLELDGLIFALRALPTQLGGAIQRGNTQVAEVAVGTTLACARPLGVTTGQTLVACVATSGGTTTGPSGWTLAKMQGTGSGAIVTSIWLKTVTNAGTEPTTYTWASNVAAGRISVEITTYAGVNTTTPQDVTAAGATKVAASAGQTVAVPSVTTVTAGAVLIGAGGTASAASPSLIAPSEMLEIWQSTGTGRRLTFADEYRASAGATGTRTWTQSGVTTLEMQACVVALRPA